MKANGGTGGDADGRNKRASRWHTAPGGHFDFFCL